MAVVPCCITFGIILVGGLTYGIILALRPYFHKADIVNPFQPINNASYIAFRNQSFEQMFRNDTPIQWNETASAFPHIPGLRREVPPQCGDPTFACQDLASARLCGVVKTCIHDIWSTMSVPNDNDEVCDICKEMVKEARDQLLSNMTQEEIKEVFEGSCKLLPIKLVADACIKVVDEIIPELVEMLASRMDPTMVCTVSGMCFATHTPTENRIFKIFGIILAKDRTTKCDQCTTLIQDAQTFMKSSSEDEVKTYVEKFCDQKMPSYLCDMIINHYLPDIYKYLETTPANDVCSSVGICPKKCNVNAEESKLKDDLTCEFCEHVLQHVKDLMTTNTTVEEFKTALLNFCKHTGSFSDKCTSLVNDYCDMIFDGIKNLDTKVMCTLMGLCDNKACSLVKLIPAKEPHQRFPFIKLRPAERNTVDDGKSVPLVRLIPANVVSKKEMKETNDIFQPLIPFEKFVHPVSLFEKDTECALCKAFSFYLEKDLAGDKSKDGVRNAINNICDKWMLEYPDHCSRIVQKYSLKMQYAVAEEISFEDLCSNVKACPLVEKKTEMMKLKLVHKAGPFCDLCKDAMNEVEKELSDPAIKQKLKSLADQGCTILPQSLRDDCVNFINQNIDAVIDILQQELKPDNICPALGLCAGAPRISVPSRIKDLECDVCKDVVTSFRQKLQDPASKEIVLTFLEEGCARLPTSLATECKKFVDEEIDTLMNIIIQEMDPNAVCSLLNICPAVLVKESPVNDIECELCKEVVSKVEDLIKDQKTEDEIKAALDKVCSYLPASIATKCEEFIDQYTDLLIQLLVEEVDPDIICAALNVCPSKVLKPKPKKVKDIECDLCKEVVTQVENMVKDKKTEDEIRDALDKACSYLPSSMAAKCEDFVNKYTELLLSLLAQEMDPEMVCAALNVCPTVEHPTQQQLKSFEKAKDIECEGCQYALHFLQNELMDSATQDELKNLFKEVCSILPETFRNNCEAFVDEYGSSLFVLIAQEIDPSKMCYELKMCYNQTIRFDPENVKLNTFRLDECSVCTTVVDYLDKLLEEDDVDKEITQVIERVCSALPSSFEDKCTTILETYGPYLLQMIGQLADSKQVCQDIDLCPRSATSIHLIGGSKCTFGPSYWCRSNAHASACKAEMYCKSNVWKN